MSQPTSRSTPPVVTWLRRPAVRLGVLLGLWGALSLVQPAFAQAITPQQVASNFTATATAVAGGIALGVAALSAITLALGYLTQNPRMVTNSYWGFGGAAVCAGFGVVLRMAQGVIQALSGTS
jgi:hypothetical protein